MLVVDQSLAYKKYNLANYNLVRIHSYEAQ